MRLILSLIITFSYWNSWSQQLKIGDRLIAQDVIAIPDNIEGNLDRKSLTGKLIILDFWSTTCTSCVAAFPEMDSLQKQFGDKIQIVLVTKQTQKTIDQFFIKHKKIKQPALPMITGDTILSKLFPYVYVPHHVWIDSLGFVRFITSGYNSNKHNIKEFLSNKELNLREKLYVANPAINPLSVISDNRWKEKVPYYSLLTKCLSGVTFSNSVRTAENFEKPNYISLNCASISRLYMTAFGEGARYNFSANNTVILKVKDRRKFVYPSSREELNDWTENNSYNYNLKIPPEKGDELYKIMQQDLVRFFGLNAKIEKRKIDCLVLVRTTSINKLKTKGGVPDANFWVLDNNDERYLRNMDFNFFTSTLSRINDSHWHYMPFVDETGITGNVDISILRKAIDDVDFDLIRTQLKRYDLDLIVKKKYKEVLVLTEK